MEFTIRPLKSTDIFPMAKILNKMGVGQLKQVLEGDTVTALFRGGKDTKAIGTAVAIDLAGLLLSNLPSCETEIYNFLSSVTGIKTTDLRETSMADFAEMIIAVCKREEFTDFIGVVSKLLK